ncbi:MAG: EF-hand domain-containing protein [Proteobacteria bacterium]|nr:EF-hand domain-containing protein [Pseudomonadota bacterium]
MKKVLMVVFVLFISIAFVSTVFAQAKPAAAPEKAAPAKASPAPEKAAPAAEKAAPAPEKAEAKTDKPADKPKPKPKPAGYYGEVANVDVAAKTLTVKTKKDAVTFDIVNAKFKGYKDANEIKVGDKVAAKYSKDGIDVKKIAAAKPAKVKKEKPAVEKKEKPAAKKKGFKDIDANKDGKITIEELTIVFVNVTPEMFKQFDKNNDGALDEKEFKDASKAMK